MTSEPDRTTPADRSADGSDSHGTTVRSTSDDDTSTYAPKHYQDLPFDRNSGWKSGYIDFSSNPPTRSESTLPSSLASASTHSNDIHQMLTQAAMLSTQSDSDGEDDGEKHVATAKKLLFPSSLASSFPEVAQTLRNERRQEFCPIYTDETPEQVALRQAKRKPVGSLLAKRIRWDELKRKREADDYAAQMQFHYNAYGPAQSQQQASFANPYEQYYTAMQHQQEEMVRMYDIQQRHSGFWPEYQQQSTVQSNDQPVQNSMQQYPYPPVYSNVATGSNYYPYGAMQPPPPPPDEPYPY